MSAPVLSRTECHDLDWRRQRPTILKRLSNEIIMGGGRYWVCYRTLWLDNNKKRANGPRNDKLSTECQMVKFYLICAVMYRTKYVFILGRLLLYQAFCEG
jgi:hypothetical protein